MNVKKAKTKRECGLYLPHQAYVTLFTKYSMPRIQSSIWKSMKVSLGQIKGSASSLSRYYSYGTYFPECGVIRKYRCSKQNKKDTENFMNENDMVPKKLKLTSALRLMSGRMHAHGHRLAFELCVFLATEWEVTNTMELTLNSFLCVLTQVW